MTTDRVRPLRVWGWTAFPKNGAGRMCRVVVATRTKREALSHYRGSRYAFDRWAAETRNARELAATLAEPGVAFCCLLDDPDGEYERVRLT